MSGTRSQKIVLFDYDGVIADSFSAAFEVQKMICPNITEDDYRRGFEGNIYNWQKETIKHADNCRHDLDFFAEYVPRMKTRVKIVLGMPEVIKNLSKNYQLFIISSTITSPIKEFMDKYEASQYFTEIMGADIHTSKSEKIKMILKRAEVGKKECIFITDTLGDMVEAEHVGIDVIGVSWGFHNHDTLMRGKPFRVVDKPYELPMAIMQYFVTHAKIN